METRDQPITNLLHQWEQGDRGALDRLMRIVYEELHRRAEAYMRRERAGHTFRPTDLIGEAFLRLASDVPVGFTDRVHFFAIASVQMRRVLVDHARRRAASKRGNKRQQVTFDEALCDVERPDDLVALDDALAALAALDERKARIVELYYFGGMEQKEIALAISVHENTVARDLRLAKAWLRQHLTESC